MSMEVASERGSLGQFASNRGYSDLILAVGDNYPTLADWFETGVTEKISDATKELKQLAAKADSDVAETAHTLAGLISDEDVAVIHFGTEDEGEGASARKADGNVAKAGSGVMIALFPDAETAAKLALPNGETPDELHVTLAYLGKAADIPDFAAKEEALRAAIAQLAERTPPVVGALRGPGRFTATEHSDGQDVIYAGLEALGIQALRNRVVQAVEFVGLDVRKDFEYTPHLTLQYIAPGADFPVQRVGPLPVTFNAITLCIGGQRMAYPLQGSTDTFELSGTIVKKDEDRQLVFGWFSIVSINGRRIEDTQHDVITPETLEQSAYDFVLYARKGGEMHDTDANDVAVGVGKLVESVVFTDEKQRAMEESLREQGIAATVQLGCVAWWGGMKISDPETWRRVRTGELRAWSIGGRGKRMTEEEAPDAA